MNIRKLFTLIVIICLAFSIMGQPKQVLAQEPETNNELNMIEYPVPSGASPSGIVVAPDGSAWFAEWGSGMIGRITTDGTITEFDNGCNSVDIIVGPDGNIWFTGTLYGYPPGGWLGQITSDGSVTKFPTPTQVQFSPHNLTLGPDGNIWFTEAGSTTIAKFVLDGSFTEYNIGVDSPHGITSGPDGNLWVAGYGSSDIAKITLDGVVTRYALPTYGVGPFDIAAGPDGNLWFVEYWGTSIGRITPDGVITEFPLSSGYGTSGITVGLDGNLWFTEPWNDKIGRITPEGVMTEYSMPAGSTPGNIATSPDGSLWVSEGGSRKIAHIIVNQSPAITGITAPVAPVQLGQSIDAMVLFSDPDIGDTHTITWDWGDGSITTTAADVPSIGTSHLYVSTGVYTVMATITDRTGLQASATFQYVVVYDSDGGFVTGGGWIDSPSGAYTDNPSLSGKATFGFVSKYQVGANVPSGNTEFQFKIANINFKSTSYDWLVVGGTKAQYKGTGLINGEGKYGFMLTAVDGTPDKFRIKIWDIATDSIIYDNIVNAVEDANPTTTISGGSIVIHK